MKTLYIIGNGFDLAHGHKTSYANFRTYLEQICSEEMEDLAKDDACILLHILDNTKVLNGNWNNFEHSLSKLSLSYPKLAFMDDNNLLREYEDWAMFIQNFSEKLHNAFEQWIRSIALSDRIVYKLNQEANFLCFNYVTTLEEIYKIPTEHIYYIHGRREDGTGVFQRYVIGHCASSDDIKAHINLEMAGRGEEIKALVVDMLDGLRKDTEMELRNHHLSAFISKMGGYEKVLIIGHGLGAEDVPYFNALLEANKSAVWIRYCREVNDKIIEDTHKISNRIIVKDQSEIML